MPVTRRKFISSLPVLGILAVPPVMAQGESNLIPEFTDNELATIEKIMTYFSQNWGGRKISSYTIKSFLSVKLEIDKKYYSIYRSLVRLYIRLFKIYKDDSTTVAKILEISKSSEDDSDFKVAIKELLMLYVAQSGFKAFGLLNFNGYIAAGYLDKPTPYRTAYDV